MGYAPLHSRHRFFFLLVHSPKKIENKYVEITINNTNVALFGSLNHAKKTGENS